MSQTSFPFSFWSHCDDQPDCCSLCLAVSFDRCDRFMAQGRRVYHLTHTPHRHRTPHKPHITQTPHTTHTTHNTHNTHHTHNPHSHTPPRHHTPQTLHIHIGFNRSPRTRTVCGRPNQTTFCASSTAHGTRCGLGKHQEWSITSTPELPALSPISIAEVRAAASSSKAVTSVTDGSHSRHFRFLSEEALGG